ncbi:alpha/beta fold hydrolase [Pseudoduganella namucuonensis]|uniref:Proline iminopeptidase n=1 Tax=Pseudoduganella namucuonensis TaxID=1035707 RepID=A0A1I7M5K1_9BURK|nr:alpha/beta hydrolase [Pseudoduganella namucuonensis]SFV17224.1 proline iminopeptidase [Pseudoduganella namucuonensis]
MPTAQANGVQLAYETSGDPAGTPVLLVMGLGLQLISWPQEFVEGLVAQGCYVIRYDNRDSGLSTKFDHAGVPNLPVSYVKSLVGWPLRPAYTLSDMADDARGLLEVLGVRGAHVIGISMGGMISQIFAARFPEQTLSLTSIMSTSGRKGLPGPTRAARLAVMRPPPSPRSREQLIAHMAETFRVIGSPAFPMPEEVLRERIERSIDRSLCPAGVARQLVAIAASGDRSPLLRQITRPALVIHGAQDPLLPVACGIDTARRIAGAVLHVIDGMGHDLPPQLIPRLLALINPHVQGKMAPQTATA